MLVRPSTRINLLLKLCPFSRPVHALAKAPPAIADLLILCRFSPFSAISRCQLVPLLPSHYLSTMAGEVEPAKKVLLPYLQRADELKQHEPLVAYYCRLYAMERGLNIPAKERSKTTNAILISLMNQLEKDKKSIQLSPEDNFYIEGFALNVFSKADKQDRAGRADLNTAKTFYAASIFIEVLHQFGPLQPDMEQKQKYAVWKAADIRKALSEGRKPVPGPPGGDAELSVSTGGSLDTEVDLFS